MVRTFATLLVAWSLLATIGAGQQAPVASQVPRFRTSVELIMVDVSVLDRERRPVKGLAAADFTVLEDGKPQPISTFTAVDLPDVETPTVAWAREVPPDVHRNDDLKDRRIVVIVLDDATPMPMAEVPNVKTMARKVIQQLGPHDLTTVVYALNKRLGQDFTSDRTRLLAAVNRFNGTVVADGDLTWRPPAAGASGRGRDPAQGASAAPETPWPQRRFDEFDPSAMTLYQSVVGTINGVARALAALPERRKALFFVSIGLPFDPEEGALRQSPSDGNISPELIYRLMLQLQEAFDAARRANVNVYGIDPGGLRAGPPSARDRAIGMLNQDFLRTVSENTGGFVITNTDVPDAGITQIFRENASYYLLGYESPNARADGRFRKIEIKVDLPRVTVRARNGYYEPRAGDAASAAAKPATLATTMSAVLPKGDIGMQVAAAPFAIPDRRESALAIVLRLQQAAGERETGAVDTFTVVATAYDEKGDAAASERVTLRITHNAGSPGHVQYEMLSRLDVKPGHYQLRLAADSSLQAKSGSVYADVDVPDFSGPAVSLSGVLLSAAGGTVARKDHLASLVPVVPTAVREFTADEAVSAFARVYLRGKEPPAPVVVAARILDASGARVFEQSDTLAADRFSSVRAADYTLDLPLARLKPGPHLLTIEATSGKTTARRDVRFEVR